mmetsp:Transcript_37207/g.119386  ORF Transcript_37207/g.119386 Transcript_37207/m.119386 type:complete len:163 (+) Transcript_37207:1076-1564(+)
MSAETRPARARIVGTIVFSHDRKYESLEDFLRESASHKIDTRARPKKRGKAADGTAKATASIGVSGWEDDKDQFSWYISSARALAYPVLGPVTKGIVGCRSCRRCVIFQDDDDPHPAATLEALDAQDDGPPPALRPPRPMHPTPVHALLTTASDAASNEVTL